MTISDDHPDIDTLDPEATVTADLLRRAARIRRQWAHAMDLLEQAEHEEQRLLCPPGLRGCHETASQP